MPITHLVIDEGIFETAFEVLSKIIIIIVIKIDLCKLVVPGKFACMHDFNQFRHALSMLFDFFMIPPEDIIILHDVYPLINAHMKQLGKIEIEIMRDSQRKEEESQRERETKLWGRLQTFVNNFLHAVQENVYLLPWVNVSEESKIQLNEKLSAYQQPIELQMIIQRLKDGILGIIGAEGTQKARITRGAVRLLITQVLKLLQYFWGIEGEYKVLKYIKESENSAKFELKKLEEIIENPPETWQQTWQDLLQWDPTSFFEKDSHTDHIIDITKEKAWLSDTQRKLQEFTNNAEKLLPNPEQARQFLQVLEISLLKVPAILRDLSRDVCDDSTGLPIKRRCVGQADFKLCWFVSVINLFTGVRFLRDMLSPDLASMVSSLEAHEQPTEELFNQTQKPPEGVCPRLPVEFQRVLQQQRGNKDLSVRRSGQSLPLMFLMLEYSGAKLKWPTILLKPPPLNERITEKGTISKNGTVVKYMLKHGEQFANASEVMSWFYYLFHSDSDVYVCTTYTSESE